MAILSETLSGPYKKRKVTQGKVTPVSKRRNPYKPVKPKGVSRSQISQSESGGSLSNRLGAQAQQTAQQNRAPVSTAMNVSYESDPTLARIKALNTQNLGNATTEANALRKQAIIDTGFDDVGAGLGLDASTLEAARQNPFSTRATIARTSAERGRELDESLNQGNLFFSGHRAQQLGDLAFNTAEANTRAGADLRGVLGGIDTGVLEAQQYAAAQEQQALQVAAQQAQEAAYQQAYLDSLNPPPLIEDPMVAPVDPAMASMAVDPYMGADVGGGYSGGRMLTPDGEMVTPEQYALMVALGQI